MLRLDFPNLRLAIPEEALTNGQEILPWTFQVFSNIDGFDPKLFSVQISIACPVPKGGRLCFNSISIKEGVVEYIVQVERNFTDE